jgi:protein-S-isoprenylcysteine O-methyltransferase Ste14
LRFEHLDHEKILTILSDVGVLTLALLFVICVSLRPPAIAQATGLMPRIAAIAGTYLIVGLVLLTSPEGASGWLLSVSLVFMLTGTAFATYAISYLGRSISLMAEARALVTGGPYRFVRHPLYLGEQIAVFGVILQCLSIFAVSLLVLQMCFQFYRMSCEEKILSATFPGYAAYARHTYRILPGIY